MGKTYTLAPRVEFEALATGDYTVTLLEVVEKVEEKDTAFSKRGDIRLEFHWEVAVPGDEPMEKRDWSSIPKTFSKKSKFVAIAIALGLVSEQEAIEYGCAVDFEPGLGKRCVATIVRKQKEGSEEWTNQITGYTALTRIPTGGRRRPAVAAVAEPDEAEIPF